VGVRKAMDREHHDELSTPLVVGAAVAFRAVISRVAKIIDFIAKA